MVAQNTSQPLHRRIALIVLPFATGIGLVVYILTRISLRLGITAAVLVGAVSALLIWRKSALPVRAMLRRRVLIGIMAGILATLAYDLVRYLVVSIFPFVIWPFDVFPIFGQLLIGPAPRKLLYAVGWAYHIANGAGFAVGFTILFPKPGVLSGLLFAGVLEFLMISLYPSWLGVKAYGELLSMSVAGHLAYGLVLGTVAKWGITDIGRSK